MHLAEQVTEILLMILMIQDVHIFPSKMAASVELKASHGCFGAETSPLLWAVLCWQVILQIPSTVLCC